MVELDTAPAAVSLAEAQAYARVETGEEEALLAGLLRSATATCEEFTGQRLIRRPFRAILPARGEWQRLAVAPVVSISAVDVMAADGSATALGTADYAIDIDAQGGGWVRLVGSETRRLRVSGEVGMASDPNGLPEPLRQGIVRLAAHLFETRDGECGAPPAAVTALWRPYRRMRLA